MFSLLYRRFIAIVIVVVIVKTAASPVTPREKRPRGPQRDSFVGLFLLSLHMHERTNARPLSLSPSLSLPSSLPLSPFPSFSLAPLFERVSLASTSRDYALTASLYTSLLSPRPPRPASRLSTPTRRSLSYLSFHVGSPTPRLWPFISSLLPAH